jgi:hypothetical protein
MKPYFSVCTTYQNHASYILEWLEFHRLVGAERFFLYDNGSTDDSREILRPFVRDGTAIIHDWPGTARQFAALKHCVEEHRSDSRWIAFVDVDEFLFSPTGRPVPEILVDYEAWPGVGVNLALFGTSWHRKRPPGLVVENYVLRGDNPEHTQIKSIVDPTRVKDVVGAHSFLYTDSYAVDEKYRRVNGWLTESVSIERLRINHYYTKSEEEVRDKWATPRPDNGKMRPAEHLPLVLSSYNTVQDETIQMYLPALQAALYGAYAAEGAGYRR